MDKRGDISSPTGTVVRTLLGLRHAVGWACVLTLLLVGFEIMAVLQGHTRSPLRWLGIVATDLGFVLSFAAFATGVRLVGLPGHVGGVIVLGAGSMTGAAAYLCGAFAGPLAEHAAVIREDPDVAASRPFGADTPAGILRNIDYVEANPPADGAYSLSVGHPHRTPPEWLRLLLHTPIVLAVFAVINTVIGFLVGQLTSGLPPPVRRNTRLATAVVGGVLFFAVLAWAGSYARDWTETSGVLAAWCPLAVPLTEVLVLWTWVRVRSLGSVPAGGRLG